VHLCVATLTPLPVGFPQKLQGSAMTKEVSFDNIFYFTSTHRADRNTAPLLTRLSTSSSAALLYQQHRLLTDYQPASQQPRPDWRQLPHCDILSGSNYTIFSLNTFEKLKMFLDLGLSLSFRVIVLPIARPVENHWSDREPLPQTSGEPLAGSIMAANRTIRNRWCTGGHWRNDCPYWITRMTLSTTHKDWYRKTLQIQENIPGTGEHPSQWQLVCTINHLPHILLKLNINNKTCTAFTVYTFICIIISCL